MKTRPAVKTNHFSESVDLFETDYENYCANILFKQFSCRKRTSTLRFALIVNHDSPWYNMWYYHTTMRFSHNVPWDILRTHLILTRLRPFIPNQFGRLVLIYAEKVWFPSLICLMYSWLRLSVKKKKKGGKKEKQKKIPPTLHETLIGNYC